jgi:hypothetical protein
MQSIWVFTSDVSAHLGIQAILSSSGCMRNFASWLPSNGAWSKAVRQIFLLPADNQSPGGLKPATLSSLAMWTCWPGLPLVITPVWQQRISYPMSLGLISTFDPIHLKGNKQQKHSFIYPENIYQRTFLSFLVHDESVHLPSLNSSQDKNKVRYLSFLVFGPFITFSLLSTPNWVRNSH